MLQQGMSHRLNQSFSMDFLPICFDGERNSGIVSRRDRYFMGGVPLLTPARLRTIPSRVEPLGAAAKAAPVN